MAESSSFKSTVVGCIHHRDLGRLMAHLDEQRIDLPGAQRFTPKGYSGLDWFERQTKLRVGDRIRIVVHGDVVAFATIFGWPAPLPSSQATPPFDSRVNLTRITRLKPPYPRASCVLHCFGSHGFRGPKLSQLDRQEGFDRPHDSGL